MELLLDRTDHGMTSSTPQISSVELSRQDRTRLSALEDVIATARRWQAEEAMALREIRDRRLYRQQYETFEAYAEERWGLDRSYLYRACQWAEVIENLLPIGDIPPARESHARPLYGLKPHEQRQVWKLVCRQHAKGKNPLKAQYVADTVTGFLRRPKPPQAHSDRTLSHSGEIICADAQDGIRTLANKSVDLVLFSPPYCEQRNEHYPGVPEGDYPDWMSALLTTLRPKLVEHGNVLIVAREHLHDGQISDVWLRTRLAIRAVGYIECETLIWHASDKPPLGSNQRPRRTWEYVFWFSPSRRPFVDLLACGTPMSEETQSLRRPRSKHPAYYAEIRGGGTAKVTDLVTASVGSIPANIPHPTLKPQALADHLVRTFSPAGGLVADPTMGSGTMCIAARDAGRRYWGCDILPKYVELARRRLAENL
jgi:hypothetical protein